MSERTEEAKQAEHAHGGRHAGREVALQVLYALDLGETGPRDARAARAARDAHQAPPPGEPRSESAPPFRRSPQTIVRRKRKTPIDLPAERDAGSSGRFAEEEAAEEEAVIDPVAASNAAFDRVTEHFSVPGSAIAFARELVAGVAAHAAELDLLIGLHARNWRVSRMAAVDRNVLRLAVYELRDTETPVAVVIDEAVDLARRFGSDTSPSFVNGILDAVAREVRAA